MRPVHGEHLRAWPVEAAQDDPVTAQRRFEVALRQGRHPGDGTDDDDGQGSQRQDAHRVRQLSMSASPQVLMHVLRQSVQRDVPDDDGRGGDGIEGLLRDIADFVRVGRRMPGDRWRLSFRLRPEVLEDTELEIACTGGELSVVLRTASEQSYRVIVEGLPALNAALAQRQLGGHCAGIFWVNPHELR
ncbi:type III secretion HpaP family protein [Piscinibacter terrae]|uniref:Flagellar hook-length control protein FliK n=1 Tax=Piscinibacter terrae TaxID=2496871 RepID=A0A3N7JQJ3_9BURK|nr:type III secretion HpaP family protein [Albitalea terrae]RQP21325.1 flagellar hook-length control protein FliK [Albitalea terrae]